MRKSRIDKEIEDLIVIRSKFNKSVYKDISNSCDSRLIKRCIERRDDLGLTKTELAYLIAQVYNYNYSKICLENSKELGLGLREELYIAQQTDKKRFYSQYVKNRYNKICIENNNYKNKITLPPSMTIGVEIESENSADKITGLEFLMLIIEHMEKGWEAKSDASLDFGTEIISPVLKGDHTKSTDSIKRICTLLNMIEQEVSERCGGHIHIGADYLKSEQAWKNLIEIWCNNEKIFFIISNRNGEIPREEINSYASPFSRNVEETIEDDVLKREYCSSVYEYVQKIQGTRNYGMNLSNVGNVEKNTIEFRLPNGTIDADVWIDNINLFGGLVRAAEDITYIQLKDKNRLTDKEKELLRNLNIANKKGIKEVDKLEAVLDIIFDNEEQRDVYKQRYIENQIKFKHKRKLDREITSNTSRKKITINSIGKAVFTGAEAVTGQEYEKAHNIIRRNLLERRQLRIGNRER